MSGKVKDKKGQKNSRDNARHEGDTMGKKSYRILPRTTITLWVVSAVFFGIYLLPNIGITFQHNHDGHSMDPSIVDDDLVITADSRWVPFDKLKVGDVVVYKRFAGWNIANGTTYTANIT